MRGRERAFHTKASRVRIALRREGVVLVLPEHEGRLERATAIYYDHFPSHLDRWLSPAGQTKMGAD